MFSVVVWKHGTKMAQSCRILVSEPIFWLFIVVLTPLLQGTLSCVPIWCLTTTLWSEAMRDCDCSKFSQWDSWVRQNLNLYFSRPLYYPGSKGKGGPKSWNLYWIVFCSYHIVYTIVITGVRQIFSKGNLSARFLVWSQVHILLWQADPRVSKEASMPTFNVF